LVHGGAWDIPDEAVRACNEGCRNALSAGWSILASGGSALEAVEAAVIALEDDPVFDAGFGSHLNADGKVECDAIVMDGATLRGGAAAGLQRLKNPIRLARKNSGRMPAHDVVGEGAERFATLQVLALCKPKNSSVSRVEGLSSLQQKTSMPRFTTADTSKARLVPLHSIAKAVSSRPLPPAEPVANFLAVSVILR